MRSSENPVVPPAFAPCVRAVVLIAVAPSWEGTP